MKSDAGSPRPPAALPPLRPAPQPAPRHAGSRAVPAASCSPAAGPGRAPHAATTAHKRGTAPPGTAPPPLPAPPGPSRLLPAPPGRSRPAALTSRHREEHGAAATPSPGRRHRLLRGGEGRGGNGP